MRVSTHTKSWVVGVTDQLTGLGLKFGVPVASLAGIFLLITAFGGHLEGTSKIAAADRADLMRIIPLALQALIYASIVVVASVCIRLHRDERTGQFLSFLGAVFCLGSPALFGKFAEAHRIAQSESYVSILDAFCRVGMICLLPGLILLLRDTILRIWMGVSVKRVLEKRWGDEEERQMKHKLAKFYGSCWDMAFCRDFVKKVCPAWQSRKPCWRVKVGCYCDENTILRAMTAGSKDNEHVRGIMQNLGLDKPKETKLSSQIKRARCRRCGIYAEHQRQKYRLLSPMVFPLVGLFLLAFYEQITGVVGMALAKTDKIMSILTYHSAQTANSFSDDGRILTTLAVIWLTMMVISYSLKFLEYLVFELQV